MSYRFVVTGPLIEHIDARTYATYDIVEDDDAAGPGIAPADEWKIPGIPTPAEITHYESHLEVAGAAATINPRLGLKDGFVEQEFDSLADNVTAAAYIRNLDVARIKVMPDGTALVGRSNPNVATGSTGVIRTSVTVRWGHS